MNKTDRKTLNSAINIMDKAKEMIDDARCIIEEVKDEESDKYDNLPEGIQSGERGEAMSENVTDLENITSEIESICDEIDDQIDSIKEVIWR